MPITQSLRFSAVPTSLRVLIGWTLLGNAIYAACQWGALIILTKLGNAAMVGQYSLGTAIAAPILMLSNLQLRAIQASDVTTHHAFRDYFYLRLVTTTIALFVIVACVLITPHPVGITAILLAVGAAKCVESLSDVIYGHLQRQERMDRIARSLVLKGAISVLAFGATLILFRDFLACSIGLLIGWFLVLVGYDLRQVRSDLSASAFQVSNDDASRRRLLDLVKVGLPMGLALMLLSLSNMIPRYFIEAKLGLAALGYYSAVVYPTILFQLLTSGVGQAATPRLAVLADGDVAAYWRLLRQLGLLVMLPVTASLILAWLAGRELLTILYSQDYAQYTSLFFLVLIGGGAWALASVLGYGATAARVFKSQAPIAALIAVATLMSCAVLVPRLGLIGAAWANIAGGITACVTYAFTVHLRLRAGRYRHS